jgi:predicted ABC-type ATPase
MRKPNLYVIAGPNGAGKTTFARVFLPKYVRCNRFVNPDLIAQGLAPFDPARAGIQAGRLVLLEVQRNIAARRDFAFESTLAGRTYRRILRKARTCGYRVAIFFLWLPHVNLAMERIVDRVAQGGHDVAEADVRRRFARTLANVRTEYGPLADVLYFFDNSGATPQLVFVEERGALTVLDEQGYARVTGGATA